jgi:hypothetical protein
MARQDTSLGVYSGTLAPPAILALEEMAQICGEVSDTAMSWQPGFVARRCRTPQ